jgi:hypothetical protein
VKGWQLYSFVQCYVIYFWRTAIIDE